MRLNRKNEAPNANQSFDGTLIMAYRFAQGAWPFVWFFSKVGGFFAMLAVAQAQDLEPRAYANTPIGLNFLIVGYSYSQGSLSTDPSIPLRNAKLQTNSSVFAYARSLDVFGLSGKFDVILPTSWLSGSALFAGQSVDRTTSGFGDPKFRFSVNLYGAPALTLDEFKDYQQDIIIGASVQVTAPGGEYTPTKLVNIGSNRWSVCLFVVRMSGNGEGVARPT